MTPEHERWAEALLLLKTHGDRAFARIAERVHSLSLVGDQAGVQRWIDIAGKLDEIQDAQDKPQ